jgi:cell division inhibitor SepF
MSGAMRRIGEYLGLLEDTGRYDDEYADDYQTGAIDRYDERRLDDRTGEVEPVGARASRREQREARAAEREASVSNIEQFRRPGPSAVPSEGMAPAAPAQSVAELSRITTLHPRTYNEARTVGENFRDGTPVIMNLSDMDDADAKRLVDFAAGLVFASRGTIERITNRVFLLSPPNVSVAAEDKARIVEGGFFNQS